MKRMISLLLSAALLLTLLPACQGPAATSEPPERQLSALEAVNAMLPVSGYDGQTGNLEYLNTEGDEAELLPIYLENAYGLQEGTWEDAAVIRATGASAFELAVLRLDNQDEATRIVTLLTSYLYNREGDFAGYAPAQADMAANGEVAQNGAYAALCICPNPDRAAEAFFAAFVAVNGKPQDVPTATATPEPTASATASPEPAESATISPEPTESAATSPEPAESAATSPEPTESVATSPEPAESAATSPEPTASTATSPEPTASAAASPEPAASAAASPEPTASATASPEPTATASPEPPANDIAYYPGRQTFIRPNIDDMSIYDTSAILAAWENNDPSSLSDYDKAIYNAAQNVLNGVISNGMSDLEKETAVYNWIVNSVNYDWTHQDVLRKTPRESFTPYGGLVNHTAVCLGYAATFQLLMDMVGVECITVVGACHDSREDHGWNMVRLNGKWYCVDVTWDANYREQGYTRGREREWTFFNVTSSYMASNRHQWDYPNVPEAVTSGKGKY